MSSYLLLLPIFKVFFTDEIFRRLAQLIDLLTSAFLALLPSWCCGKRQRTINMLDICIQTPIVILVPNPLVSPINTAWLLGTGLLVL